jgi:hypothetical protein
LAPGGLRAAAPGGGLAGELAGDSQRGLPATNRDGEDTKMKRRLRRTYLGSRNGGRGTGEGDRGGAPAGGRCSSGGAAAVREERRGGARGGEEVLLPFYRAEGEVERAR